MLRYMCTMLLFTMNILYPAAYNTMLSLKDIKKPQQVISDEQKLPLVFHPYYDIGFFGLERFHPFDSKKYGKVAAHLQDQLDITINHFYVPKGEVSQEDLFLVHDQAYINSLSYSVNVERIAEFPGLSWVYNPILQYFLLSPMRYATQGTIDAALLAAHKGVAINLGGGYHHAKRERGGGFCVYADIPLAIIKLREETKNPEQKVLYVDLDAHQGNGVASCVMDDEYTYILDCFNEYNYPTDRRSIKRINKMVASEDIYCQEHKQRNNSRRGFTCQQCNDCYLTSCEKALKQAIDEYKPDFIFYNAGTDCFEHDQIGAMALSQEGIIARDEMVFAIAKGNNIPLCMTLSGGYSPESAGIIGMSICNLYRKDLLKR